MPEAINGTTTIHYDTKGDRENPSILLIMGYTEPMTSFKDGFCQLLVDAGYHVIRFDNRDVGLTSKTQGNPPDLQAIITAVMAGVVIAALAFVKQIADEQLRAVSGEGDGSDASSVWGDGGDGGGV